VIKLQRRLYIVLYTKSLIVLQNIVYLRFTRYYVLKRLRIDKDFPGGEEGELKRPQLFYIPRASNVLLGPAPYAYNITVCYRKGVAMVSDL